MKNKPRHMNMSVADTLAMMAAGIEAHPGYTGAFTRATAKGAIPSGERIQKVCSEDGDTNPDGALGTVLGSYFANEMGVLMYWIEWDALPLHAVFTMSWKVGRCQ